MKIYRMEVQEQDYIEDMGLQRDGELGDFRIYRRGIEKYLVQELGNRRVIVWAKFDGDGDESQLRY
jgi:hypothetical protein